MSPGAMLQARRRASRARSGNSRAMPLPSSRRRTGSLPQALLRRAARRRPCGAPRRWTRQVLGVSDPEGSRRARTSSACRSPTAPLCHAHVGTRNCSSSAYLFFARAATVSSRVGKRTQPSRPSRFPDRQQARRFVSSSRGHRLELHASCIGNVARCNARRRSRTRALLADRDFERCRDPDSRLPTTTAPTAVFTMNRPMPSSRADDPPSFVRLSISEARALSPPGADLAGRASRLGVESATSRAGGGRRSRRGRRPCNRDA